MTTPIGKIRPSGHGMELCVRIAVITTVGFLVASLSATTLDGLMSSHVIWGARQYPLGYGITLFAPAFFITTYFFMRRNRDSNTVASWLPFCVLALPFLVNFRPEVPHFGYAFDIFGYAVLAFLTAFLEKASQIPVEATDASVPRDARIRRLEEGIKDWRGALVFAVTAYILVMMYWINLQVPLAQAVVTERREVFLATNIQIAKIFIFSIFVFIGPLHAMLAGIRDQQGKVWETLAQQASGGADGAPS